MIGLVMVGLMVGVVGCGDDDNPLTVLERSYLVGSWRGEGSAEHQEATISYVFNVDGTGYLFYYSCPFEGALVDLDFPLQWSAEREGFIHVTVEAVGDYAAWSRLFSVRFNVAWGTMILEVAEGDDPLGRGGVFIKQPVSHSCELP